jgi:hypothetical protein
MSAARDGVWVTMTQLRVTAFLLDREAPHLFAGPDFRWVPTPRGPRDQSVETEVSLSINGGFVVARRLARGHDYRLSERGRADARDFWWTSDAAVQSYVATLLIWVRGSPLIEEVIQPYPSGEHRGGAQAAWRASVF